MKTILKILIIFYILSACSVCFGKDYNTMYPRTKKVIDLGKGICGECCGCKPIQQYNAGGFIYYWATIKEITIIEELHSKAGGGAWKYSSMAIPLPKASKNDMFYIEMIAYQIIYNDKVRIAEDNIISLGVTNYVHKDLDCDADNDVKKPNWVCVLKTVYRDGVHNWKR